MHKKIGIAIGILFLFSAFIALLWLRPGHIISTGESGMPFYNLLTASQAISHAWSDGLLGVPTSYSVGNYYIFYILGIIATIIPSYLLQNLLFLFFIFLSQVGIFYLFRKKLPRTAFWFSLAAAAFYTCNLITVVNVWNRLQYPFIFLYGFLPLGLVLFMNALEKRNFLYALYLNFLIVLFPLAFTSIPMIELLWFLFSAYGIFFVIIQRREKKSIVFAIQFFILLSLVWVVFNLWWLLQLFSSVSSSSFVSQTAYNQNADLETFSSLSQRLGDLSAVFRLVHKDFFDGINPVWHNVYTTIPLTLATFLIPFLVFLPLTFKKKPAIIYFFLGFSLITIFLLKGSAPPFGDIFTFFFTHLRLLEAFRNPFEKFSLLLPLGFAIPLGYSLFRIYQYLSQKRGRMTAIILASACVLCIILASFPLFNRWVFMNNQAPANDPHIGYYAQVPGYYAAANAWLNDDTSQFRVVALPMASEGITYTWPYGYSGVEISNGLFDKPFISFAQHSEYSDLITNQIEDDILQSPQYASTILSLLNVKYIMTRSDIDYTNRQITDPQTIDTFLKSTSGKQLPNISYDKQFGSVTFYKNNNMLPLIYTANAYAAVPATLSFPDAMELTHFTNNQILVNPTQTTSLPSSLPQTTLLSPSAAMVLDSTSFPHVTIDDAKRQLYIPRVSPASFSYPLVRLKENLETYFTTSGENEFFKDLTLSNKRLGEFVAVISTNKKSVIEKAKNDYITSIQKLQQFNGSKIEGDNLYYFRSYLIAEKLILQDLAPQIPVVKSTIDYLGNFFVSNTIEPRYASIDAGGADRAIYAITIPETQSFEILLRNDLLPTTEQPFTKISSLQIDNTVQKVLPVIRKNWISFGTFFLTKGKHEIQFSLPASISLLQHTENKTLTVTSGDTTTVTKKIALNNIDPHATYRVSFDFWFPKGNSAKVALTDDLAEKSKQISNYQPIGLDGYNNDFVSQTFTYALNSSSKTQFLLFTVTPYNNCQYINAQNPILSMQCIKDKAFYNTFSRQTVLYIKNLRVEKVFTNQLVLKHTNQIVPRTALPLMQFVKDSPSDYTLQVSHAQQPFFLVFSESFNPLWQLTEGDTGKHITTHYFINSYANAWYIDRKGSYTLHLAFAPEKNLIFGKIISGIAMSITAIYLLFYFWRKKHE